MLTRAIVLDAYGTLLSTGTGSVDAVRIILERHACSLDPRSFYARWKRLHRAHMRRPGFLPERQLFELELHQLYLEYGLSGDPRRDVQPMLDSQYGRVPFPDASACLAFLRTRYRLIVASNSDTEPLLDNLRAGDLAPDAVFTSEDLGCYKPDGRFYRQMLRAINLRADEVVFIGDSPEEDVLGPQRLGIPSMLLDRSGSMPTWLSPARVLFRLPTH